MSSSYAGSSNKGFRPIGISSSSPTTIRSNVTSSTMRDDEDSSYNNSHRAGTGAHRRDISQFVKYLLEGSGIDEQSLDFAELRRDLERPQSNSPEASNATNLVSSPVPDYPRTSNKQQPKTTSVAATAKSSSIDNIDIQSLRISMGSLAKLVPGESLGSQELNKTADALVNPVIDVDNKERKSQPSTLGSLKAPETAAEINSNKPKFFVAPPPPPAPIETASKPLNNQLQLPVDSIKSLNSTSATKAESESVILEPKTLSTVSLQSLSRTLEKRGFPSLPAVVPQTEAVDLLINTLHTVLSRNNITQPEPQTQQPASTILQEDAKVRSLKEQVRSLEQQLEKEKELRAQVNAELQENRDARSGVGERAKKIIAKVRGHPVNKRPLPVTNELFDIVNYYEMEMNKLRTEISEAKQLLSETSKPKSNEENELKSDERVRNAMMQELKDLRQDLADVNEALQDAKEQNEVLKLRLLNNKTPLESNENSDRRRLTTHELVQRDKKRYQNHKMNLDGVTDDEAKTTIRSICQKLKIQNVAILVEALDDIARTISLIPQMQNFIRIVDAYAWAAPKVADAIAPDMNVEDHTSTFQFLKSPHKLAETAERIKQWRLVMDTEVKTLEAFQKSICSLLRISDSSSAGSQVVLKKCLNEIKKLVNAEVGESRVGNSIFNETLAPALSEKFALKVLQHFQDIFEVRDADDMIPKMNDLYVVVSDTRKWMRRFQKLLQLLSAQKQTEAPLRDDIFHQVYSYVLNRENIDQEDIVVDLDENGNLEVHDVTLQSLDALLGIQSNAADKDKSLLSVVSQ